MRHDFGDQIQVRYFHTDGEHYNTWVSGTEALQRLQSIEVEAQLRSLSRLNADDLKLVIEGLPEAAKDMLRPNVRDEMAERLESMIGSNLIGEALSDAVRGQTSSTESTPSEKDRWHALLHYEPFRHKVLELAWIALEGSFPDVEETRKLGDWI
jgi:hypothetical protein